MRLLFYTATAVFVILAGIFAFFAMQSSDQDASARVVLSIDTNERPPTAGETERLQADIKDVLARAESQLGENGSAGAGTDTADRLPQDDPAPEPAAAEPDPRAAAPEPQPENQEGASSETVAAAPESAAEQNPEASPEPQEEASQGEVSPEAIPGTMLAGIDSNDRATESEVPEPAEADAPEPQAVAANPEPAEATPAEIADNSAQQEQEVAALRGSTSAQEMSPPAAESPAPPEGSLQTATPAPANDQPPTSATAPSETSGSDDVERKLRANFDAFLAERQEKEDTERRAAVSSPPFPPRRPENIPTEVDSSGSWAGRQVAMRVEKPRKQQGGSKEVRIAILLRGVGRDDRNSSDAVTKLPPAVSLGFMPFTGVSQQWARKARELGHEVIVQLPLEPSDYPINNPGPETLLSSVSGDENLSRVGTILSRFENYSGVSNYLGGKLLQSEAALRPLVQGLKSRGLIYVGEGNNSHVLLRRLAAEVGLRYGGADMMIDAHPAPEEIRKSLERLAELARKDGSAIGMGYASKTTIEQLQAWTETLAQQGITLVPVGALAQTPGAS
jgi:polysaccharide deacetylase 2 family uncharacterized protein YibQ